MKFRQTQNYRILLERFIVANLFTKFSNYEYMETAGAVTVRKIVIWAHFLISESNSNVQNELLLKTRTAT